MGQGQGVRGRELGVSGDLLPWGWAGTGPRRGQRLWSSSRTHCRSANSSAAQQRGLVGMGQSRVRPAVHSPATSPALPSSPHGPAHRQCGCPPSPGTSSTSGGSSHRHCKRWGDRAVLSVAWGTPALVTQPRGTCVIIVLGLGLQATSSSVGLVHCPCPSQHLREVVQGVRAGPWPHQHTVHLTVQPIKEEPQELLCILLAARHGAWPVSSGRGQLPSATPAPIPLTCSQQSGEHISGSVS